MISKIVAAATTLIMASVLVTEQRGQYERDGVTYQSAEACIEAAKDGLQNVPRICEQVNRITVEGTCADVPAPEFVPELTPRECPDGISYALLQSRQTTSRYPYCWKTVTEEVVSCGPHGETFWTPGADNWTPDVDPYEPAAP